ncbi:MAG TPA: threonine/serine dehydratase [Propionibacteriaceae bacterium]|nr:threonine/serine dehydratase [Propionibacteriaceae bacterium]
MPTEATAVLSDPNLSDISLAAIRTAAGAIAPYVVRTPTLPLDRLSTDLGLPVVGKFELLQHTGSFKVRGAFSRMQQLTEAERAAGVVAVSGGNHGLAVAYAARVLGIQAAVIMPATAAPASVEQVRADGAQLIVMDTIAEVFARAVAEVEAGKVLVHPFDDPAVVAGQGTLALELHEDAPEVTDVLASVGGGGMITGVAAALKALNPAIRVWGVETEGADVMTRSLRAGEPVTLDSITSIATTLGAPTVAPLTLAGVRELVEEVLVVPDAAAVRGIEMLAATAKVITEPATGCVWAAALRLRERLPAGARLALILCGGNAGLDDIAGWRNRFPAGSTTDPT